MASNDPRIEPILRGLARQLGGDRAAAEIARIMRLPGTLNYKYDPPRPCQMIRADWGRRYTLEAFEKFVEPSRPTCTQPPPSKDTAIREGQRNSYLTSLAGSMRHRGMTAEAIVAALLAENSSRCQSPLPETEVRGIAKSIARYSPAEEGEEEVGLIKRLADAIYRPFSESRSSRGSRDFPICTQL